MNWANIDSIKIERRCMGRVWNITMFVKPKGKSDCVQYGALVDAAENIMRDALKLGPAWAPNDAEVMAWSEHPDASADAQGMHKPHLYRVTLNMCREKEIGKEAQCE